MTNFATYILIIGNHTPSRAQSPLSPRNIKIRSHICGFVAVAAYSIGSIALGRFIAKLL